jgi:predicted acylesterase/phospholipase RssA
MRGLYTAAYLDAVAGGFARQRGVLALDLASGFDLIAGTSTGAVLACAIANRVSMQRVAELYRKHGHAIFPRRVPQSKVRIALQLLFRSSINASGAKALRAALAECYGTTTPVLASFSLAAIAMNFLTRRTSS